MARYQIMYWKEFPVQVKAEDDSGVVKAMLPDRFSESVDAAAMAEGSTGSEAYLSAWEWGSVEEREGSAQEVLDAVVAELDDAYPRERLVAMIQQRRGRTAD
ncbi:MAG: virulence factor [Chloroflexota bacterium]|nr:virulence factor [Chloroflexota bacterium]